MRGELYAILNVAGFAFVFFTYEECTEEIGERWLHKLAEISCDEHQRITGVVQPSIEMRSWENPLTNKNEHNELSARSGFNDGP